MKSTAMPAQRCFGCGEENTLGADIAGEDTPVPGSLSVCAYCGYLTVFGEGLILRELTPDEFDALPDAVIAAVGMARRAFWAAQRQAAAEQQRAIR